MNINSFSMLSVRYWLLFFLFFFLQGVSGKLLAQQLPDAIQEELLRSHIPPEAVTVLVQPLNGVSPLISHNTSVPFYPASVMKMVTTYAALELLGPSFQWKTKAYTTGAQLGDILFGDLIIKGSGDPHFFVEDLWLFLRQLRARGIREIRGNILLDGSVFKLTPHDAAAFDGEPLRPYNAGPSALLLNFKVLDIRFIPDEFNKTVKVNMNPPLANYPAVVPTLVEGQCGDWKNKLHIEITDTGAKFEGEYASSCGEKNWVLHPYQMSDTHYFGAILREIWSELGGEFSGKVKKGNLSSEAQLLVEQPSPMLSSVVRDVNKQSNNVMARHLLLSIAAGAYEKPANPKLGVKAIRAWLSDKGIKADDLYIENGSGLSRQEKISADALAAILKAAYASPVMPEFMASLSLLGRDGTTWRRLRESSVAGRAHLKTGAIQDVRAIAGYVLAASGQRYLLVFIINHPNTARARALQDRLLLWVHDNH